MLRIETVSCGSKHLDETLKALAPQDERDITLCFDSPFELRVDVEDLTIEEEADEHVILRTNNKDDYDLKENQYFTPSRSPTGPSYELRERVLGVTHVEAEFVERGLDGPVFHGGEVFQDGQLDVIINDHVISFDNAMMRQMATHQDECELHVIIEWTCVGEAR